MSGNLDATGGGPISLDTAQTWIRAWRDLTASEKGTAIDGQKAMLIPESDVQALVKETGAQGIRVYYAYGADTAGGTKVFRFVVVATTLKNDIEMDILIPDGTEMKGIYDFCLPCPNTCDPASPLNNLTLG